MKSKFLKLTSTTMDGVFEYYVNPVMITLLETVTVTFFESQEKKSKISLMDSKMIFVDESIDEILKMIEKSENYYLITKDEKNV